MDKCIALCKQILISADKISPVLDRIIAVLLAFTPVLQHYQAPIFNAALTVIVLFVPYLLLRIAPRLRDYRNSKLGVVAVFILYLVYRVIDHGTSFDELGQSTVLIVYMVAVAYSCIDVKTLCKSALVVSVLASSLLILQYIGFYVFKTHLQLVPTDLLIPSADQWILGAQTGLAGITGKLSDFYRPSAFFLEPSHVYIYMFPHLLILLFGEQKKHTLPISFLLTAGLILCTSGMGIAFAAGAWVLYFALYDNQQKSFSFRNILRKKNLIMIGILLAAFVMAFLFVPTVRRTVSRIFTSKTGVTAIGGRITRALETLQKMTPMQWIIGVEDTTHSISYNMPGLVAALYRHGMIGMVMSVEIYLKALKKLKIPFFLVSAVYLVTSLFSAHTHSTIGMLYYTLILMYGYQTQQRESGRINKLQRRKRS